MLELFKALPFDMYAVLEFYVGVDLEHLCAWLNRVRARYISAERQCSNGLWVTSNSAKTTVWLAQCVRQLMVCLLEFVPWSFLFSIACPDASRIWLNRVMVRLASPSAVAGASVA